MMPSTVRKVLSSVTEFSEKIVHTPKMMPSTVVKALACVIVFSLEAVNTPSTATLCK